MSAKVLLLALALVHAACAQGTIEEIQKSFRAGEYASAVKIIREALRTHDLSVRDVGHFYCAALMQTGDTSGALRAAEDAIKASDEFEPFVYVCAARAHNALGNGRAAVSTAKEMAAKMPKQDNSRTAALYGEALSAGQEAAFYGYFLTGDLASAERVAADSAARWPKTTRSLWLSTLALAAVGKHEEATKLWKAPEDGREDAGLYAQLARLASALEKPPFPALAAGRVRALLKEQPYFKCVATLGADEEAPKGATIHDVDGRRVVALPRDSCGKEAKEAPVEPSKEEAQEAPKEQAPKAEAPQETHKEL